MSDSEPADRPSMTAILRTRKAKKKTPRKKAPPAIAQADPNLHPPRTPGFVTWCELLLVALHAQNETTADIVNTAPAGTEWLHVEFKPRAWQLEGCPFTVWTKTRVYFPVTDRLSEWVGSVPRAPNDEATPHQGVEPCDRTCCHKGGR